MISINPTAPLTYTTMSILNSTDLNDSYEYYYGDLVTHCHIENYSQVTGICYIAICCFSFLGNGMLLYTLARFEDLKRVTMLFLLCLAFFDLLFTLTLPFWAVDHLKEWIFGNAACKILIGAYFVGIYGSLILLTAMTVDCFFFIVVRSQWFTRKRRLDCARAAVVCSWIISIGACLNDALSSKVKNINSVYVCDNTPSHDDPVGYYTQFVMLFALPLLIIILCYGKILHTLMSGLGQRRYKTLLVVLLIILAFIVCWGPYHFVLILLPSYGNDCPTKRKLHWTFLGCRILAYFHCCINPLLFLIRGRSRNIMFNLLFCQHKGDEPPEKSSDPSHFNLHQRFSVPVPQNITELKSL